MSPPPPLDFLDLDHLLCEEERLIRDTTRSFVTDRILPEVAGWFERGELPRELAKELGDLGLLGMHLEGYGCAGTNAVSYGLACLELEAGDSGARSFVSVQGSLAMFPIWKYGSEEQKQQWLPRMAAGEVIGCFGLTEPDYGSDPAGMRTSARRDGGDWVLNGTKMWITNGGIADVAVVWARTDDEGVRGFLVPTGTAGLHHPRHRATSCRCGPRSPPSWSSRTAGCPATPSSPRSTACAARSRASTRPASASSGARWARPGPASRAPSSTPGPGVQFGRPIGGFQLTQQKLADMLVELTKGTLLALQLGRLKDEGRLAPEQVSLGKLNNVREALDIAREARTILGANGITLEYPVIRHMNNLESVLTYEGTNEIHTLILGPGRDRPQRLPVGSPPSADRRHGATAEPWWAMRRQPAAPRTNRFMDVTVEPASSGRGGSRRP